ncbi:unnamed protein product [Owenia fusiformis]|uniref:Uncharacterized protein n=1 Tax=Owenia fusiformis TaxID=6347 RepID=A0A8J1TTR7_OWEFU|nr:unnamed protein product [Owenia fusiformis]
MRSNRSGWSVNATSIGWLLCDIDISLCDKKMENSQEDMFIAGSGVSPRPGSTDQDHHHVHVQDNARPTAAPAEPSMQQVYSMLKKIEKRLDRLERPKSDIIKDYKDELQDLCGQYFMRYYCALPPRHNPASLIRLVKDMMGEDRRRTSSVCINKCLTYIRERMVYYRSATKNKMHQKGKHMQGKTLLHLRRAVFSNIPTGTSSEEDVQQCLMAMRKATDMSQLWESVEGNKGLKDSTSFFEDVKGVAQRYHTRWEDLKKIQTEAIAMTNTRTSDE